ncbi:MAG TPA: NAD(P)/FAD-dependent oxidoreductase [Anaeromyxobacteraceae bacterium]|nr:NAD(P)/FAD-dependent oxidoreductase [Anaeromyxobacteraceae bacterium]
MSSPVANDFDAVVVGSGMGGLSAAALLARLHGSRVLVLERHWRAGGFTHTFSRPGGWRWDVGVHYVGAEADRPGTMRDVLSVTTGGALSWTRMPDPFERLVFPGFEFEIRSGRERFAEDLAQAFPAEAGAVRRYLRDVERAASATALLGMRGAAPAPVAAAARVLMARRWRLARRTTRSVLDSRFRDERLKAVLGARWGDHGLPPSRSAFLAHAVITAHYLEGGLYPVGSAARIADGARRVIEEAGGAVRVRAEVERILLERGRAAGVRLAGGEVVRAPVVISDAGARATFLKLVPPEVPLPFRETVARAEPGMAHVSLYLGLSASPERLGVRGENFWIHDSLDQDALWARRGGVGAGDVSHVYLSFPSLKDPQARSHTAEIVTAVDGAGFARWAGTAWKRRGAEYQGLKERIADALLEAVERRLPGFRSLVAYRELSTPLSTEAFTGHRGGEIYGIPCTPERLDMAFLQARTPVKGLFLTGADALFLGIGGTAMSGLMAAAAVAGPSTFAALRREARRARRPATPATAEATSPSSA